MTLRLLNKPFLLVAALLAIATAVVTTQIVSAHSRPIRFDPAPGSVLQAAPAKIDGWFGSEIRRDPNWSFLHVTDAQGNRVDTGDTALSTDRLQQTATLKSGLAPGMYTVTWRTFDDGDGEIFGDCYTFFVGQAAADAAVAAKTRLDGGSKCDRIEISAKNGTPTPQQVAAVATAAVTKSDDDSAATSGHTDSSSGGGSSTGKLILGLVIGLVGGAVLGGVGMKLVGNKPS
jgi:methionine-rich copper-binding protein CopC